MTKIRPILGHTSVYIKLFFLQSYSILELWIIHPYGKITVLFSQSLKIVWFFAFRQSCTKFMVSRSLSPNVQSFFVFFQFFRNFCTYTYVDRAILKRSFLSKTYSHCKRVFLLFFNRKIVRISHTETYHS